MTEHTEPVHTAILQNGEVWKISLRRPEVRNCVDRYTADCLLEAFEAFERDPIAKVAVLTGEGSNFCAGADLKAVASGDPARRNRLEREGPGPMGVSRLELSKPVIAAISGYCVAGGLELACWCDLRVGDSTTVMGVFCRRFGVPLIDGGTVRLPRLIGQSRAMDMILTGRPIEAQQAYDWGLLNRLENERGALAGALELAATLCELPQTCMRNDRQSVLAQWGLDERAAIAEEFEFGLNTLASGETLLGATIFKEGIGRHGERLGKISED